MSSLLSRQPKRDVSDIDSLDQAIRLSPSDARAYDIRARSFLKMGRFAEAVGDFQTAITLRPNDYLLWLRLAYAREKLDDQPGALVAYREAVHLAPSYATCHWYLGRLLLRMKAREEAFVEFRRATNTDPELFPSVINYAWREFGEDADLVRQAVRPQESSEYLMLAQGFLTHGKRSDAMAMYHAAGKNSDAERRLFLAQLLEAKAYVEAYEVWAVGEGGSTESREGTLSNAGFEGCQSHCFRIRMANTSH